MHYFSSFYLFRLASKILFQSARISSLGWLLYEFLSRLPKCVKVNGYSFLLSCDFDYDCLWLHDYDICYPDTRGFQNRKHQITQPLVPVAKSPKKSDFVHWVGPIKCSANKIFFYSSRQLYRSWIVVKQRNSSLYLRDSSTMLTKNYGHWSRYVWLLGFSFF